MESHKVVWGIIGCGDVTEKKSGPALNLVDNSRLMAVMRRDAAKAADYAERHQVPLWYSQAEDLLDNSDINAIYIATPPSSHLGYALAALRKGKHVYVEKPVTLNSLEAESLLEEVRARGGKLVVAHYRRALPLFLKVKELIDQSAIGELRTVQLRLWQSRTPDLVTQRAGDWRTDPSISGGGYFFDLAPHQLDLMLYLFGMPVSYDGFSLIQGEKIAVADQTTGIILFENQLVFQGSWCFNVAKENQVDRCEIIGSLGRITFSIFGNTVAVHTKSEEKEFTFDHPENIQLPMISRTVKYFTGTGPNPSPIEEALVLMKIIDNFSAIRS